MGNSFSKIFSPGSRLGYIVGNDEMMQKLRDAKSAYNSHTSLLPQILCAEFFKRGYYPEHHKKICELYRGRRDTVVECLKKHFPSETKFTYPEGGLFTWVELPERLNTTELLAEAVGRPDIKVFYVAGEKFFADGTPTTNCMRISFGAVPEEKIRMGTERLGKLLKEKCNES